MKTTEQIRNDLIDKIISISNKDILKAVDKLLGSIVKEKDIIKVSAQQRLILEASEKDITNGNLISDEEINKDEDKWLNE